MRELPLFPLQTVLLPDGPLALRVFEARYLDMVARCLRGANRFGVSGVGEEHPGSNNILWPTPGFRQGGQHDLEAAARLSKRIRVDFAVRPHRRGTGHHDAVVDANRPGEPDFRLVWRPRRDVDSAHGDPR